MPETLGFESQRSSKATRMLVVQVQLLTLLEEICMLVMVAES